MTMTSTPMNENAEATRKRPRKTARNAVIRVAIGLSIFAALFFFVDPAELSRVLRTASVPLLILGFALTIPVLVIRAFRWRLILAHLGLRVGFWRTVEIYTISFWFNTFLPGSVGGDAYKFYDVARASAKKLRPAAAVLLERSTGILALLLVGLVGLLIQANRLPFSPWILWGSVLFLTCAICGSILLLFFLDVFAPLIKRFLPPSRKILDTPKGQALLDLSGELRANRRLFIEAIATGLILQILVLTSYWILARALTPEISPGLFFAIFPLIEIFSLLPISVNGIGIREGLLIFAFREAGIDPAVSLSLGVLFRLVNIAYALLGGALLLARRPGGWRIHRDP